MHSDHVLVLRLRKNLELDCEGASGGLVYASKQPSEADPLVSRNWSQSGGEVTQNFRVSSRVAKVQMRFSTSSRSGPWFDAPVVDGFAFVRGWATAPELRLSYSSSRGELVTPSVHVDLRTLDAAGNEIPTFF